VIGGFIGLCLFVAAIVVVVRSGPTLEAPLRALRSAPPGTIALLLGSMLAGVVLTGCLFHLLTRRFGRVGFVEMQALMATTTLANYLPLRPGLLGRLLWHRSRNDIRARDALRTMLEAIALSALALATLLPALVAARRFGVALPIALAAPAALGVVAVAAAPARILALAFLVRYAETLLAALRYHLAFELVGAPVSAETSVAIACVSMLANLVPFVSNGIGLREWSIGLLAPALAGVTLETGIAAELVQRAAEVAVVVPTGLLGAWWLGRALSRPRYPHRSPDRAR
jgi:hypothetical protein